MQRRDFLLGSLSAGLLGPAALSAPFAVVADEKPGTTQPTGSLRLGFGTYGTKSLTTERAIDLLADIGYDSVEFTIRAGWDADSASLSKGRRAALRKRLADRGLRLGSLMEHIPIEGDDAARKGRIERIKRAAELAHDLVPDAPPLLQSVLGDGKTWAAMKDRYAAEIAEWLDAADAGDLLVAVKPHRGGALSTPDEAVELIGMLGRPKRLRMCYDWSHYDFRGMTLEGTVRTALPHLALVAVKDVVQEQGQTRFVLPGESGRVDYPRLLRLLFDGGYRGDVCCEVSGQVWSQPGYDPVAAAKTCHRHLAAAFEKSGVPRG